ncbi:MAG TPA: hypothetical protein VER58_00845 [Thermoanaerobaculia bacterium]|nr:hypothetical protein [Thermoanaerobaculia bacterium]
MTRELLRYSIDGLRLASFLFFVLLGVSVMRTPAGPTRRARINVLLVYFLVLNFFVGVFQRDDWPFSPYPLMRGVWNGSWEYTKTVLVGVDATGREWDLDPMTWSPVFPLVLQEWFNEIFPQLTDQGKRRAERFLYSKAEEARRERVAGRRIGNERILGPFTASDWWIYRRTAATSPQPFVAIRVYRDSWRPYERLEDSRKFKRKLIAQYDSR